VRKQESGSSSEEPDQPADAVRIVISSLQFEWLTKQCKFLGISKQQLVVDAVEEWACRNPTTADSYDPSATAQRALGEFMWRHRDEFLSEEE
jgi:hypothetical protein